MGKKFYFQPIILDLYHVTSVGTNFKNLISFLKEGARSDISDGYGQGRGFYVWTTLRAAVNHSRFLFRNNKEGCCILKFREEITAENWDLDYEINLSFCYSFFSSYWKLFKKIKAGCSC